MKMIKTEFDHNVNGTSSFIVYVCETQEAARQIHETLLTQKAMLADNADWYYTVSTNGIIRDCRVPEFFHNKGYWMTAVEHNNGDWDKDATYTLYLVQ